MPNLKTIRKTLTELNLPGASPDEIIHCADVCTPLDIVRVIDRLDECLSEEQRLLVMERDGCCKSGQRDRDTKRYAKLHAGESLVEKVKGLADVPNMGRPALNPDGTITTGISWLENGKYRCACPTIKRLGKDVQVSKTYCGCCAGHFMYHYEQALGVKLKLMSIVSSPLDTRAAMPCEFVYRVVGAE